MKDLIDLLEMKVKLMKSFDKDMDATDWGYQEGVLVSGNEAKQILLALQIVGKVSQRHSNRTVLFAVDGKDLTPEQIQFLETRK